ncbi:uncharacterized protein LOC143259208 isoform X2 [Megalopta genalis]|uniref:uncharacterized protein LOC143259208 isoform X2 n=1 Tax=Megalopta genalis TaxID=115081 RepID=UPI003FCFC1D5
MDNNYRANISKWLPLPGGVLEKWFAESSSLDDRMGNLAECIALIIRDITDVQACDLEVCNGVANDVEEAMNGYKSICSASLSPHPIYRHKTRYFLMSTKRKLNVLARFTRNLINEIVDCRSEELLRLVFRLVNVYNEILDQDIDVSDSSTNVFHNDSPQMLEPLKKMSVTRILQILAKNRAEESCHELIDCLLANYEPRENADSGTTEAGDSDVSENSSIEIYRALTRHLTPPIESTSSRTEMEMSNVESIQTLVNTQNEQVLRLLNVAQDVSPRLLGNDALKTVKGETRLRGSAMKKVKNYYQEVAWGALSGILDHVILWWSPEGLATHHSHGAQHLKDWLSQFVQRNRVPQTVRPALQNLCDALGYHATITAWDQLFRLAYTSAFQCRSRASSAEGTDTGQKFAELFQLLVRLSNECEAGGEWVIGAPLMELPLSEQIVVLHRLDHSVHTARLWILQEAKIIAHTWELEVFFLLVKGDIPNFLEELSYLKLADHTNELSTDAVSVQVYVCGNMRAKIVSEVNVNVSLLQVQLLATRQQRGPGRGQPLRGSILRKGSAPGAGGYRGPRDVEHDPQNYVRGVARLHIPASN